MAELAVAVGTSGWTYESWSGAFYPPKLAKAKRLAYYAERLPTVELNASHYRWPSDRTFAGWREKLPVGFRMAVKAPRALTHAKKLADPDGWIERMAKGLHEFGERRGPLLVQLPPGLVREHDSVTRLDAFLRSINAVAPWIDVAVEFRNASWQCEDVYRLLERRGASYVVMSGADLPCELRATAPLVYLRWHGPSTRRLYSGCYCDDDLRWWADRLREWACAGHRVVGYFNNDQRGYAAKNAVRLTELLQA